MALPWLALVSSTRSSKRSVPWAAHSFSANPLVATPITSPLQIVNNRSGNLRVVLDLSYPQGSSVNSGIPKDTYLNEPFSLRLPGTDSLHDRNRVAPVILINYTFFLVC